MSRLSALEFQVLEALVEQYAETRNGTQTALVKAACNARTGVRRAQVADALLAMQKRGLVIGGPRGWVPTDEARAALAGADDHDEPTATIRESRSVEGDSTGEALPAVEYPATVERVGQPVTGELLERCTALVQRQLKKSTRMREGGDAAAVADIAWLRETAQMIVDAGGEA